MYKINTLIPHALRHAMKPNPDWLHNLTSTDDDEGGGWGCVCVPLVLAVLVIRIEWTVDKKLTGVDGLALPVNSEA